MRNCLSLSVILAIFWLSNSGHFSGLIAILGIGSISLVVLISYKLSAIDEESLPLYLIPRIFAYCLWLMVVISKANITVLKQIWLGGKYLSPGFERIKIGQRTDMAKVIYANSITLTPGTVAVDLYADEILVHALDYRSIEFLVAGEMNSRVCRLENS
ncbi:MAG: hypothetical protein OFPII_38140 [Osedax symbiont Rs1]|nr:MAG: hypothetical protein OFPII_38140 [Osedax symbiont Rs1]